MKKGCIPRIMRAGTPSFLCLPPSGYGQFIFQCFGGCRFCRLDGMGIDIARRCNRRMPQMCRHRLYVHPGCNQQGGVCMSQRMQCHRRQAIALDESRKPSGKRIRMDGLTVPSRKQSPAFVPLVAQLQTPLTLMDVVRFQHCGHTIGQFEHAREVWFLVSSSKIPLPGTYSDERATVSKPASKSMSDQTSPHSSPRRKPVYKSSVTMTQYSSGASSSASSSRAACAS